jgi:hypothetical protein
MAGAPPGGIGLYLPASQARRGAAAVAGVVRAKRTYERALLMRSLRGDGERGSG